MYLVSLRNIEFVMKIKSAWSVTVQKNKYFDRKKLEQSIIDHLLILSVPSASWTSGGSSSKNIFLELQRRE